MQVNGKVAIITGYTGYFVHPFVNSAFERSCHNVLPYLEKRCILLMSAKPREHLPSWHALPHQNLPLQPVPTPPTSKDGSHVECVQTCFFSSQTPAPPLRCKQ